MVVQPYLQELMDRIEVGWAFDPDSYQMLDRPLSEGAQRDLASRHIILHLMKEVAKLGNMYEKADHNGIREWGNDLVVIRDLLINTLRYASLHGYRATDLDQVVRRWEDEWGGKAKP